MNTKPKILFLALDWRPIGGLEIYNHYLAKALIAAGCEVEAWGVFNQSPVYVDKLETVPMLPCSRINASLYARYRWKTVLQKRLLDKLRRYDLIIIGHMHLADSLYSARARSNKRSVFYWICAHGVEVWGKLAPLQIQALENAQRVLAISNYTAGKIEEKLSTPARIFVLSNPVDINIFIPLPAPAANKKKVLLTVSRLSSKERYKGHMVVMRALPRIESIAKTPVSYVIIGDGDDAGFLKLFARRIGVEDKIEFAKRIELRKLVEAYQTCDVFVMPSSVEKRGDDTWSGEGFGRVYIEAAACGRPVIASNQGGAPETILDGITGFAVDPTSPDAIAEAARRIFSNPTLADRMGQAGRKFVVENFSTEIFQKRIAEFLRGDGLW